MGYGWSRRNSPPLREIKKLSVIPREVLKEKYKGKFGH